MAPVIAQPSETQNENNEQSENENAEDMLSSIVRSVASIFFKYV